MRTLKKTLCLLLALAMVLGLGAFSVMASDINTEEVENFEGYTDADTVGEVYKEAVDTMIGAGVVEGMTKTTIAPTEPYTRAQAAKIMAYLALGQTAASNLKATAETFSDVPADHWAAGYIAYCSTAGIIHGFGDGTFRPEETLSGYQFAAMLLRALGFDQKGEYEGTSWAINVAKDAIYYGVISKKNLEAATPEALERQQAIMMAYDAAKRNTVRYSTLLNDYVNVGNGSDNTAAGGSLTAVEKLADNLGIQQDSKTDDFGARITYWTDQTTRKEVSESYYPDEILYTGTDGESLANLLTRGKKAFVGELNDDYNWGTLTAARYVYVYYNGTLAGTMRDTTGDITKIYDAKNQQNYTPNSSNGQFTAAAAYSVGDIIWVGGAPKLVTSAITSGWTIYTKNDSSPKNSGTTWDANNLYTDAIGRSSIVTLYDRDPGDAKFDGDVDYITIEQRTVQTLYSAPKLSNNNQTIKIADISELKDDTSIDDVIGYEGLAKNDVVTWVKAGEHIYLHKTEPVKAKLTSYVNDRDKSTWTLSDGSTYRKSGSINAGTPTNTDFKTEFTYYIDEFGYIVKQDGKPETAATHYGVVTAWGTNSEDAITGDTSYAKIQVFTADGQKVIYDVVDSSGELTSAVKAAVQGLNQNGSGADPTNGELIAYRLDNSGRMLSDFTLTSFSKSGTNITITKSTPNLKLTPASATSESTLNTDSNTLYFIYDTTEDTPKVSVFKGYNTVSAQTVNTAGSDGITGIDTTTGNTGKVGAMYALSSTNVVNAVVLYTTGASDSKYFYITDTNYTVSTLSDGKTFRTYKTADGTVDVEDAKTYDSVGAFSLEKDSKYGYYKGKAVSIPTNGAGTAEGTLGNNLLSLYDGFEAVRGGDDFFVLDTKDGTEKTYNIGSKTKVYEVTVDHSGSNPKVTAVTETKMRTNDEDVEWIKVLQIDGVDKAGTDKDIDAVWFEAIPVNDKAAAPASMEIRGLQDQGTLNLELNDRYQKIIDSASSVTLAIDWTEGNGATVYDAASGGSAVSEISTDNQTYTLTVGTVYRVEFARNGNNNPLVYWITVANS